MDGEGEHSEAEKASNAESESVKSSDELFNVFYSEVNLRFATLVNIIYIIFVFYYTSLWPKKYVLVGRTVHDKFHIIKLCLIQTTRCICKAHLVNLRI